MLIPPISPFEDENRRLGIENPAFNIKNFQGVNTLEPYQVRLCNAIRDHDRVAVKAVHSVGKTFLLARIVVWFLTSFRNSIVLTTAPTNRQVNHLLWKEIRVAKKRAPIEFGGTIFDKPYWKLDDEWFALGYSPENEASRGDGEGQGTSSAFQGYHPDSGNILIVFDEAAGIKKSVYTQAEGMMTSGNAKWVIVGNPTSTQSEFYAKFNSRLWHKESLTCFDSPNLIANGITSVKDIQNEIARLTAMPEELAQEELKKYKVVNNYLVDTKFVIQKAFPTEWGVEHILYITKVLGEFSKEDDNSLIPLSVVESAQNRECKKSEVVYNRYIGVDPARYGIDKSIIVTIEDDHQTNVKRETQRSNTYIAGLITSMIIDLPRAKLKEIVLVDGSGVGAGVVDILKENQEMGLIPKSVQIIEIQFGASPVDPLDPKSKQEEDRKHFLNLKAKMFSCLAKDLKSTLSILPDEVYQRELPTILYEYDSKGRLKIESKEEYKKRTQRTSPDDSDALCIANFGGQIHYEPQDEITARITAL